MTTVFFPYYLNGELETEICNWVGENTTVARLSDDAKTIEFEDEELAIYFRLKFGI